MMQGMVIDMNDKQLATLAQLQAFLDGTTVVVFAVAPEERYDFIARILRCFGYRRLPRADKGVAPDQGVHQIKIKGSDSLISTTVNLIMPIYLRFPVATMATGLQRPVYMFRYSGFESFATHYPI